jgi:hypothetical protein
MNAPKLIDKEIASHPDWRGKILADIRRVVHEADPEVVEEWKWRGTPVWSHNGILCLANIHTHWVNMIFSKGAILADPKKLFNAFLEGNTWRAIKFSEGDKVNEAGLKGLVRAALDLNNSKVKAGKTAKKVQGSRAKSTLKRGNGARR